MENNFHSEYKRRMRGDYSSTPTDTSGNLGRLAADIDKKRLNEKFANLGPSIAEVMAKVPAHPMQALLSTAAGIILSAGGSFLFSTVKGDLTSTGFVMMFAGFGFIFFGIIQYIKLMLNGSTAIPVKKPVMIIAGSAMMGFVLFNFIGAVIASAIAAMAYFYRSKR